MKLLQPRLSSAEAVTIGSAKLPLWADAVTKDHSRDLPAPRKLLHGSPFDPADRRYIGSSLDDSFLHAGTLPRRHPSPQRVTS